MESKLFPSNFLVVTNTYYFTVLEKDNLIFNVKFNTTCRAAVVPIISALM
jgi:hypothetical protein